MRLAIKIAGWALIVCGGAGIILEILVTYIYDYYNPYPIFGAVFMIAAGWLLVRKKGESPIPEKEVPEYEPPNLESHEQLRIRRRIVLIGLTSFMFIILAAIILYAAPIMGVSWIENEPYQDGNTTKYREVEKTDRVTIYEYLKDWR